MLQFCATSKKSVSGDKAMPAHVVSYSADVAPILQNRCTPCHFPDGGKKKFLDTYNAVRDNYDDIMYRVQLPQDSARFMPFKHKKPALSDSMILVLKTWKSDGMQN